MKYAKTRDFRKIPVSFWYRFDGETRRMTLMPGEQIHLFAYRVTDEGWRNEAETVTVSQFDCRIVVESKSCMRDCDGRFDSYWYGYCAKNDRQKHVPFGVWGEKRDRRRFPVWTCDDSYQRDYTAESMGY